VFHNWKCPFGDYNLKQIKDNWGDIFNFFGGKGLDQGGLRKKIH
jgi:hypothetical protein